FIWFFCGVKKGPPDHRKIEHDHRKRALRLWEDGSCKKQRGWLEIRMPEATRGNRLPPCLLQEAVKLIVNDSRRWGIMAVAGVKPGTDWSQCLRRTSGGLATSLARGARTSATRKHRTAARSATEADVLVRLLVQSKNATSTTCGR